MKALQTLKVVGLLGVTSLRAFDSRAQIPTITNQPVSQALWVGGNVTFNVGVSGPGPFTYQWLFNKTNLPNGVITTVAGGGTGGLGDGGAATNASLNDPSGVAFDAAGNLYIADSSNNRIRKVGTNGIITTVAGGGAGGGADGLGDGTAATNAAINDPTTLAFDRSGNMLIADFDDSRIRGVTGGGLITTVAGTGSEQYFGDGQAATNAGVWATGVACDPYGNLYIADTEHSAVREVNTNGIITTVAGNGTAAYSGDGGQATNANLYYPLSVALDSAGNLFIVDTYRIRKVSTNGIITTVAGSGAYNFSGDNGPATNAGLEGPFCVALDPSGNLFIADTSNQRIRKVDTNGIITTVAGSNATGSTGDGGAATNASLYYPQGVAVDACGNLFIANTGNGNNGRVRKVTNTRGPALALNNLDAANAGNYQVVVTGTGGSVTSSVASLIATTVPLIYQAAPNSNGTIALNFVSQPGSTNVVLGATNLSPPVLWRPLGTNVASANGDWQFTDTNAPAYRSRFYRSLTQ